MQPCMYGLSHGKCSINDKYFLFYKHLLFLPNTIFRAPKAKVSGAKWEKGPPLGKGIAHLLRLALAEWYVG